MGYITVCLISTYWKHIRIQEYFKMAISLHMAALPLNTFPVLPECAADITGVSGSSSPLRTFTWPSRRTTRSLDVDSTSASRPKLHRATRWSFGAELYFSSYAQSHVTDTYSHEGPRMLVTRAEFHSGGLSNILYLFTWQMLLLGATLNKFHWRWKWSERSVNYVFRTCIY